MKVTHILLGITCAFIWGYLYPVIKVTSQYFPPFMSLSARMLVVAIAILPFTGLPKNVPFKKACLLSFFGCVITYSFIFIGTNMGLDASTSVIAIQMAVPSTAILAYLVLKEQISPIQSTGIMISLIGIIIVKYTPNATKNPIAFLVVMLGSVGWAYYNVLLKKLHVKCSNALVGYVTLLCAPVVISISLLSPYLNFNIGDLNIVLVKNEYPNGIGQYLDYIRNAPLKAWLGLLYMGLVATALAYVIWYHLINNNNAYHVVSFLLLTPIFGITCAVLFIDEVVTLKGYIGSAIVITGVAVINFSPQITTLLRKTKASLEP